MKAMLRGLSLVVMLCICPVMLTACGKQSPGNGDLANPVKVGALIAVTGYGSEFGQAESNAVRLLRERFPNAIFTIEDNKSDPRQAISAAQKLINVDKVDILYCDLTTVANAIVPMARESDVILVAAVYLTDLLDRHPLAIRNLPRGRDESRLLIDHLVSSVSKETVPSLMIIGSNDEFGRSAVSDCNDVASAKRVSVIGTDVIPEDGAILTSFAATLIKRNPDAIYMASLSPTMGSLIRNLREQGYQGSILTTDAFSYPYIRDAAGPHAKGVVYVDFPVTPQYSEFSKDYRGRFGIELNPSGVLLFDAVSWLLSTIDEHAPTTRKALVDMLNGSQYNGKYGTMHFENREILYPLEVRLAE